MPPDGDECADIPLGSKEVPMKIYFSPLACSLATSIALYEAGVEATFVEFDGPS